MTPNDMKVIAEHLWGLLDDIDSLSDKMKPTDLEDHQRYLRKVHDIAAIRTRYLRSDGQRIIWPGEPEPVPLLLYCPMCHTRHIDEGRFATHPHKAHACQNPKCGHVWSPSNVPTVGVWTLPGYLNPPAEVQTVDCPCGNRVTVQVGDPRPYYCSFCRSAVAVLR